MTPRQNHLAKLELRKQQRAEAGLVADRFPEVNSMVIYMKYFRAGVNPVIMQRTINVFPTAYAFFNMGCKVSGCTGGGFDLTPVITEMVRKRKKLEKGRLACVGKTADLQPDHANMDYEVTITFNKVP